MAEATSYRDRRGSDPEKGAALQIVTRQGEVLLDLGVKRDRSMSSDAWAALSPAEAREVAMDLNRAAFHAEHGARRRKISGEA